MLGYFFVFSGVLMLASTCFKIAKWFKIQKYTKVEGKIIRIDTEPWTDEHGRESEINTPVVMFSLGDGMNHYFGMLSEYSTRYPVGTPVRVVFPPGQPKKAEVFDKKQWVKDLLWDFPLAIATTLLGIYFVYAS